MDTALYDSLFVAGPARDRDPVFLAPLGDPLSTLPAGTTVGEHVPALQSALGLTAADARAVLAAEEHDIRHAAVAATSSTCCTGTPRSPTALGIEICRPARRCAG